MATRFGIGAGGGIGSTGRGSTALAAPPTAQGNGAGGPGALAGAIPGAFNSAISDVGDVMTGRITLAGVGLVVVGMLAFYYWTRSAQGGG